MTDINFLNNELRFYDIDYQYRKYLSKYDKRVNLKDNRKFLGIVIIANNFQYVIPLTSKPFRKTNVRRNPRATVEIHDKDCEVIAALLINNMIPVTDKNYMLVDINSERDKDYLISEYNYIRKNKVKKEILRKVRTVFKLVNEDRDSFMRSFCCDFLELEKLCLLYNNKVVQTTKPILNVGQILEQ